MGYAAAFGRLCVETAAIPREFKLLAAAAFGRLCVETIHTLKATMERQAAAFGRLCVETRPETFLDGAVNSSRLRAAVC